VTINNLYVIKLRRLNTTRHASAGSGLICAPRRVAFYRVIGWNSTRILHAPSYTYQKPFGTPLPSLEPQACCKHDRSKISDRIGNVI